MSYRHTLQAGLESLREIEQMLADFREMDHIPSIELDLVLQKTRNFYDIMLMLRQHQQELMRNRAAVHTPSPDAATVRLQEEVRKPEQAKPTVDAETKEHMARPDDKVPVEGKAAGERLQGPVEPADEPDAKSGTAPDDRPQKPEKPKQHEVPGNHPGERPSGREKEATILSERFSGRSSLYDSIHETISQKDGGPIGQVKPVSTIRSAIGINDRFTFIRELFNNDAAAYDGTIGILDDAANFNEAYNYMIQRFDWDMDSGVVQQLLDIIRRKYITGRHE